MKKRNIINYDNNQMHNKPLKNRNMFPKHILELTSIIETEQSNLVML